MPNPNSLAKPLVLAAVFCILVGGCILWYVLASITRTQKASLIMQATQASLLVDNGVLQSLRADVTDLDRASYQILKKKFLQFRAANSSIRFVYILGYRPDLEKQFFYLDSEPTNSSDYSPPGQLYEDTRPYDIEQYKKGMLYVDGPYRDSWGEWVSGYAPVLDEYGQMAGLVGIDISTKEWHTQRVFAVVTIILITIFLYTIIGFFIVRLKKTQEKVAFLTDTTEFYASKNNALESIKKDLKVGTIMFFFPLGTMKLDELFITALGFPKSGTLSSTDFFHRVHPDDRQICDEFFDQIRASFSAPSSTLRLCNTNGQYHTYMIKGETQHEAGAGVRFSGSMQDMSA